MPQSSKLPVLNLLTGQKSGFFCPTGATRCTDTRQTWQGWRAGAIGCAIFHLNRSRGWEYGPKYQKFPLFGRVALQGRLPWPISKIFSGFYTTNYPTLVFQISCDSRHRFIHSFIHSFICSESQVQISQCVTQCEPDSKAQKRALTTAL